MNMRTICLLVFTILPLLGFAQSVAYGYDASGNRISRALASTRSETSAEASYLFRAAPNPVSDMLQISYEGDDAFTGTFSYTMQSVYGESLISGTSPSVPCKLDVSGLAKGVYILSITYRDSEQSIKIIKK